MGYRYSNLFNVSEPNVSEPVLAGISPMNLLSIEMGNEDVTLVCTYGKLSLLIEHSIADYLVGRILKAVSEIYSATTHDMDVVCDFEEIQKYQTMGYTLVSYGRSCGKYRVTFTIPFSSEKALFNLTVSICREARSASVRKDFYWNGTDKSISRLFEELKDLDGWRIKSIRNKEPDAAGKT